MCTDQCKQLPNEPNGEGIKARMVPSQASKKEGLAQRMIDTTITQGGSTPGKQLGPITHRPFTISTTPRHPCNSSSLRSIKFAKGNHDSSVPRRDFGFDTDTDEDEDFRFCCTCVWKFEAGGGRTRSSSSSMGRRALSLVRGLELGGGGDNTNDDMDVVGWGRSGASPSSSSTSASPPVSSSLAFSSSSSSLMLMKFRWRTLLETRPRVWERPSRHASALERSTLRLRTVREVVTVPAGERDMKDSCRVRRKLGDESGDTGDAVGSTWLDV